MTTINFNGQEVLNIGTTNTGALKIGDNASCNQDYGIGIGNLSEVTGSNGIALGRDTEATTNAIGIGRGAQAVNTNAISIGFASRAYAVNSIAIGSFSKANSERSIAIGRSTNATGVGSICIGPSSSTTGDYAIAIGNGVTAAANQTAIRNIYNTSGGGAQVFVTAAGKLNTNTSSITTKHNIRELEEISIQTDEFKPLRFTFNATNEESIGHLAENIAQVIPELCVFDKDGNPNNIRYDLLSIVLLRKVRALRKRLNKIKI